MAGGPANLGSAEARIGFRYDPTGFNQWTAALRRVNQQQQLLAQQHAQATNSQQAATGATRSLAQASDVLHRAQQRVALAQTDAAGKVRILQAEYQRLTARAHEAGLAQDELTRRQTAAARAQLQLVQAQNAQARGMGPALPRTLTGVGAGVLSGLGALGVATSGAQLIGATNQAAEAGRQLNATLDEQQRTLGAVIQNQGRASQAFQEGERFAAQYGFTMRETGDAIRSASTIMRESVAPVNDILSVMSRLAAVSPEQGLQGAAFAIRELAGGDIISLVERFEISRDTARAWRDEIKRGADVVEVLDAGLRDLGFGQDVLEERTKGAAGQQREYNQALEEFQRRLGELKQAGGLQAVQTNLVRGATELLGGAPAGGPTDINADIARQSRSFEQYQASINAFTNVLRQAGIPGMLAAIMISHQILTPEQYAAAKAMDAQAAATAKVAREEAALIALRQGNAAALARVGETMDRGSQAQTRRDATNVQTDVRRANELALTQDIIGMRDQLVNAEKARDDQIEALDEAHAERRTTIADELAQAQIDSVSRVNAATGEALNDRARLEQANAQRIVDLVANAEQQRLRLAEDRRIADARDEEDYLQDRQRSLEDFQRQQAQAADDFERGRRERLEDYQERRGDLIADFNRNEQRLAEDQARDLAAITRRAQLDQYQSTASFLERLYGLTRGRRRKGQLEEGVAAQRAAIEEARALVAETGDPAAGAALLAARQQQYLANLEAGGQAAQLRRDARRGGPLSVAAVEEEIAAVTGARAEANQAEIDFIKESARVGQQDRTREAQERRTALGEQLTELDTNYADQEQKQRDSFDRQQAQANDAFAARRKQEELDRAELLAERDADRKLEDERRVADYTKQYTDLVNANTAALKEWDRLHGERIQKLEDALKDEDTKWEAARKKVNDNYDTFLADLKTKIETGINNIDVSPTTQRQNEQKAALALIGEAYGKSLMDAAQATIDGRQLQLPTGTGGGAAGGTIGNRNPADDPRPTSAALQALFGPTARITSTYDDTRPVGQGVSQPGHLDAHGGLDVTMDKGARVPAPFDMQILKVSGDQFAGGVTVLALDRQGHQWLFAHLHGVEGLTPGQWLAKGKTLGYIGAEGHVHVQERLRNDASIPIDPTAHLMAAASPTAAVVPRPAGGVVDDSGGVSAQTMQQYQRYGSTAARTGPTTAGAPTYHMPLTIDLHGSTFGAGVSMTEVEAAVIRGGHVTAAAVVGALKGDTAMVANKGALR